MPQMIQRSFTSGEIAPGLQSRADLVKYATGLNLCENFFVRAQGGAYSRPGFKFIGELGDSSKQGRLIPFSFNTEQTYILVFEHLKMRVIKNGGYVLSGGVPYEIATPYTEADLPRLQYTQSADVMTIVHPSYDARNLSRTSDTSWTLSVISYASTVAAPTFAAATNSTITNITNANPAVVTTSAAHGLVLGDGVYITGVVGMTEVNDRWFAVVPSTVTTFQLFLVDSTTYGAYVSGGTTTSNNISILPVGAGYGSYPKTYAYVVTAVDADGIESLASAEVATAVASLSSTAGLRITWNAVAGADYYRVYKDPSSFNTGIHGWVGDSTTTSFEDYNFAPITSDTPPEDRQPFTGAGNKPSTVTYYQQRQVFANTLNEPQVVYTTQVGNFNSFRISDSPRDDDAVTFTIAAQQVNEIRHILSLGSLVLLTSGGEWLVSEGQNQVLTPSTIGVRIQSYNGASWVQPVVINSTALYVQEKGARVRDLGYQFSSDTYTGNNLSVMSEHLFEGHTITEMAYANEPYGILWCVRDDGTLLGLTYLREHEIIGWHQHTTSGTFESVATISEDGRDAPYVIVNRTINGATKRYIERLEKREATLSEDCFYVDSGLSYSGAPATVISGLDHLEGEDVAVLADGYEVTGKTVSSGSITLDRAASKVHVGLAYTPAIETLDIDISSAADTVKSKSVSVSEVVIELEKSRGGFVGARQDEETGASTTFREIKPRFDVDSYAVPSLKTYKAEVNIDPQWSKGGGLRIEQRSPLPMAILSIIPRIDVGGN